jgi:hypothetical protein
MANDPVLQLAMPPATYERLRQRAAMERRTLEESALQAMAAGLAAGPLLPPDLVATLAAMALLDDRALRQATRLRLPNAEAALFAALNDKEQRAGLSDAERHVADELAARHGRIVAMRAEAIVLLHQRGHDISALASRP